MAQLRKRPDFDPEKAIVVRRPFLGNGRNYKPGDRFPKSDDPHRQKRLRTLYKSKYIDNIDYADVVDNTDELDEIDSLVELRKICDTLDIRATKSIEPTKERIRERLKELGMSSYKETE